MKAAADQAAAVEPLPGRRRGASGFPGTGGGSDTAVICRTVGDAAGWCKAILAGFLAGGICCRIAFIGSEICHPPGWCRNFWCLGTRCLFSGPERAAGGTVSASAAAPEAAKGRGGGSAVIGNGSGGVGDASLVDRRQLP